MQIAINDLQLSKLWVIHPGKTEYPLEKNVSVLPLEMIEDKLA